MGRDARRYSKPWARSIAIAVCGLFFLGIFKGCEDPFRPVGFSSPPESGNVPPQITVLEPNEDLATSQGESFVILWTDSDPDDNALIDIDLLQTDGSDVFQVASGLRENDETDDVFVVDTEDIVQGNYFVRMTINDQVNTPVSEFAENADTGNRAQVTITQPGLGNQNAPPRVFVVTPEFNIGVSQSDILSIAIRPRLQVPAGDNPGPEFWYDQEGNAVNATILLDLDEDPTNDDAFVDDDPGNIILSRLTIEGSRFDEIVITEEVDVQEIPVRQNGLPYFVRATVTDGLTLANDYAAGRVHVLALVEGSAASPATFVDLAQIGRTLSGAVWVGFNPFANLGSKMASAMDQDNDGVGDFVMVAQYGNPRNFGNIGEAYLVYGLPGQRFGGTLAANSVATDIPDTSINRVRGNVFRPDVDFLLNSGVVTPGIDDRRIDDPDVAFDLTQPYTLGITDVVAVRNLGTAGSAGNAAGCPVPELFFGLPHNEYMGGTADPDPSDEDEQPFYCYPDFLSNNYTTDAIEDDPSFVNYVRDGFFVRELKQGSAVLWYGENNLLGAVDDGDGDFCDNLIASTREVYSITDAGNQGPKDGGKAQTGARFSVAIFDYFSNAVAPDPPFPVGPLNSHYGKSVATLPDVDLNGAEELVISAPRSELEAAELRNEFGDLHPHITTRLAQGNVIVFLGQDFNAQGGVDTTASIPFIFPGPPTPSCDQGVPRFLQTDYRPTADDVLPFWFRIRGVRPNDKLGGATLAGDFNLDGPADILAGAPFYDPLLDRDGNGFGDPPPVQDAGAVYIIFLRLPFGNTELACGDVLDCPRPPQLRIVGETEGDHLGLRQEYGGDINTDGVDDVIIASKDYNSNGLVDNGFVGIVFGERALDGNRTVSQLATSELRGVRFFGNNTGDYAGADIAGNGDFNGDSVRDIMISAPGETFQVQGEDKPRRGVTYLIFGGRHLENQDFTLSQVGTEALPGVVFVGPYQEDTPDTFELDQLVVVTDTDCDPEVDVECGCDPEIEEGCTFLEAGDGTLEMRRLDDGAPESVAFVGDVNGDGFGDIMIGNPTADFFDPRQPGTARRTDTGEIYLVYGNNFGANTLPANVASGS